MPRLGDPKVTLVLVLLILLAVAVKAEFWPEPAVQQPKASPGAKAGLLAQQGKMKTGPEGPEVSDALAAGGMITARLWL